MNDWTVLSHEVALLENALRSIWMLATGKTLEQTPPLGDVIEAVRKMKERLERDRISEPLMREIRARMAQVAFNRMWSGKIEVFNPPVIDDMASMYRLSFVVTLGDGKTRFGKAYRIKAVYTNRAFDKMCSDFDGFLAGRSGLMQIKEGAMWMDPEEIVE
jgi:hypothetical protein